MLRDEFMSGLERPKRPGLGRVNLLENDEKAFQAQRAHYNELIAQIEKEIEDGRKEG